MCIDMNLNSRHYIGPLKYYLVWAIICMGSTNSGYGQSQGYTDHQFKADLIMGLNFSQLDGDGLFGFDKLGLRGGIGISYPLSKSKTVGIAILYDQRGSRSRARVGSNREFINLNYISLPLMLSTYSWWQDGTDYYKIRLSGSITPARLISTSSSIPSFDQATDQFKRWDLSLGLGVDYAFGRRHSVEIRIDRSVLRIYNIPNSDEDALQSYFLHLAYHYHL
jgi:hypothetical protein